MTNKILRALAVVGLFIGACGLVYNTFTEYGILKTLIVAAVIGGLFFWGDFLVGWSKVKKKTLLVFFLVISIIIQSVNGISVASVNHSWDAGAIQHIASMYIDTGVTDPYPYLWEYNYLLRYGNNIHITYLVVIIYRLADFIGIHRDLLLILINNILILLAVFCIIFVSYKRFNTRSFVFASVVAILLMNLSPYSTVFYTDTLGVFFVAAQILILYLLLSTKNEKKKIFLSGLLGVLFCFGYMMKPTTILVLTAIAFGAILFKRKYDFRKVLKYSAVFIIGVVSIVFIAKIAISNSTGFANYSKDQINEKRAGAIYYLGMGALRGLPPYENCKTGAYCSDYADRSVNVDMREWKKHSFDVIKNSVMSDFPFGWLDFAIVKISRSFNDGSFGVWKEGSQNNNSIVFFLKDENIPRTVRRVLSFDGDKIATFRTVLSVIWFIVIVFCIFFLVRHNANTRIAGILSLFVLAVILYQVLFENRARYLFVFLPIFILSATTGVEYFLNIAGGRRKRSMISQ